jgi:hypothetical protein
VSYWQKIQLKFGSWISLQDLRFRVCSNARELDGSECPLPFWFAKNCFFPGSWAKKRLRQGYALNARQAASAKGDKKTTSSRERARSKARRQLEQFSHDPGHSCGRAKNVAAQLLETRQCAIARP